MPFSSWWPRSSNSKPAPATSIGTAAETRSSPAAAASSTRVAMWTAIPAMSSPLSSTSPVCSPARISKAEWPQGVAQCDRATDRPTRTVERREDAVASGLDQTSGVLFDNGAGDDIVTVQQVAPGPIAERRQMLGRSDEVGEQDRSERTVGLGSAVQPAQELLDMLQARRSRFHEQMDVPSGKHRELRSRDVCSKVPAAVQRRYPDSPRGAAPGSELAPTPGRYAHPSAFARRTWCSHLWGCRPIGASEAPSGGRPGHEPRRERRARPWLASPTLAAMNSWAATWSRCPGIPRGELRGVARGGERRGSVDEDQPSRTVRMTGREQDRDRRRRQTIRVAPPAPTRPHPARPARHRPTVPKATAAPPRPFRGTRTAAVEHDQPRLSAKTTQEVHVRRPVPTHLHRVTRSRREQQVDVAIAQDLIRDAVVARPRETASQDDPRPRPRIITVTDLRCARHPSNDRRIGCTDRPPLEYRRRAREAEPVRPRYGDRTLSLPLCSGSIVAEVACSDADF